jgi:hemerythrin superfamily protein
VIAVSTIERLRRRHRDIDRLLVRAEAGQDVLKELARTLTAQLEAEREELYPAVLHLAQSEVLDAYENQAPIERALRRAQAARVTERALKGRLGTLKGLVRQWAADEEGSLFPTIEQKLSEHGLEAMGAQIESHFLIVLRRLWQTDYAHPPRKTVRTDLTRIARLRSPSRRHEPRPAT